MDRPVPQPGGAGEVLVKIAVSGVNFTDLNQRSGLNKIPLPAVLGAEERRALSNALVRASRNSRLAIA